jgi:hypothetical protein
MSLFIYAGISEINHQGLRKNVSKILNQLSNFPPKTVENHQNEYLFMQPASQISGTCVIRVA